MGVGSLSDQHSLTQSYLLMFLSPSSPLAPPTHLAPALFSATVTAGGVLQVSRTYWTCTKPRLELESGPSLISPLPGFSSCSEPR